MKLKTSRQEILLLDVTQQLKIDPRFLDVLDKAKFSPRTVLPRNVNNYVDCFKLKSSLKHVVQRRRAGASTPPPAPHPSDRKLQKSRSRSLQGCRKGRSYESVPLSCCNVFNHVGWNTLLRRGFLRDFIAFALSAAQAREAVKGKTTDLETIINWIAHPFELSELILKPEYL